MEKGPHEIFLHAGPFGMDARGGQAQRRSAATIRAGFSVYVGPAVEQQLGNVDDVCGRFLPKVLDAVCRDIVQQGSVMRPLRACPDQFRLVAQQSFQCPDVT